eukprot:Tamp_26811.p1 GENE.Tamp_26811~~Tamp_26811.p1  ORF type:complete len:136 (+),score=13.13 Tamp_26811:396-803(+)
MSKSELARARLAQFENNFVKDLRNNFLDAPAPPAGNRDNPPADVRPTSADLVRSKEDGNAGLYSALEGVTYVPEAILGACHGEEFYIAMQSSSSFDSVALLLDEEGTVQALGNQLDGLRPMPVPPCEPLFLSAIK